MGGGKVLSEIARIAIGQLNRNGFEAFVKYLIEFEGKFSGARTLTEIDERIIECPPERFYHCADAFFLNYYPVSLYKNFSLGDIDLVSVEKMITQYLDKRTYPIWLPTDGTTIYSINNFDSSKMGISDEELLNYYESNLKKVLSSSVRFGFGNINTFVKKAELENGDITDTITDFFKKITDGLSVSVSEDGIVADYFVGGNEFPGITAYSHSIANPVIKLVSMSNVLAEFNALLNSNVSEQKLEDFLTEHYRFLFGEKYDCIMTQLWIKFPELDIGKSNRRLDIFMRNSVSSDWEMYELKRPSVRLTKTVRDVPVFTGELNNAIAQARNYKNLLSQDKVRRQFEKEGIEYFQPEIHVVIGRSPEISNAQWRRIISDESSLNILTYDDIYKSAELRLKMFSDILNN